MLQFSLVSVKLLVHFCRQLVKGRAAYVAYLSLVEAGVYCWTDTGPVLGPPVRKPAAAALLYSVNAAASLRISFGGLTRWCTATGRTARTLGRTQLGKRLAFKGVAESPAMEPMRLAM